MNEPLVLKLYGDDDEPVAPEPAVAAAVVAQLRRWDASLYALVDAARNQDIWPLLSASTARYQSLLDGEQASALAQWAPYLVRLSDSPLLEGLVSRGWGQSWGLYLASPRPFKAVRRHFARRLLVEHNEKKAFFRFYDPRVMRKYLPQCTMRQLSELFGDVERFFVEGEQANTLHAFSRGGQGLLQEQVPLTTVP